MNYHTNYLLNATISLPLSLSSSLWHQGCTESGRRGIRGARGDVVGVHNGSTLKLKLPSKRYTFF